MTSSDFHPFLQSNKKLGFKKVVITSVAHVSVNSQPCMACKSSVRASPVVRWKMVCTPHFHVQILCSKFFAPDPQTVNSKCCTPRKQFCVPALTLTPLWCIASSKSGDALFVNHLHLHIQVFYTYTYLVAVYIYFFILTRGQCKYLSTTLTLPSVNVLGACKCKYYNYL
jgi:hypothetical protein